VKPGDIVKINDGGNPRRGTTRFLYGGDEKCWDEHNSLIPTDIPFGFSDVGVVLRKRKMVLLLGHGHAARHPPRAPWNYTQSYVKILTPRGIGWVFENWIMVVKNETYPC